MRHAPAEILHPHSGRSCHAPNVLVWRWRSAAAAPSRDADNALCAINARNLNVARADRRGRF